MRLAGTLLFVFDPYDTEILECGRAGHNLTCNMSAVGTCADNAASESFFGLLKRDRAYPRQHLTRGETRSSGAANKRRS